jgi:hypothetical protein
MPSTVGRGMKHITPLFRYRCANPEHQRAAKGTSDTITIHEHSWAYCPYDVRAADHLWSVANPDAPVLLRAPADPPARG